jgi:hypothetical protein
LICALLPWVANLKIQRFIQTSVTVHEQRNPSFYLDISVECEKHEIIKRRVTKNDIIRTLKFCKRRTQEGETMWTRPPRATEALQAKRIDAAMEKWLATGQTPPTMRRACAMDNISNIASAPKRSLQYYSIWRSRE